MTAVLLLSVYAFGAWIAVLYELVERSGNLVDAFVLSVLWPVFFLRACIRAVPRLWRS